MVRDAAVADLDAIDALSRLVFANAWSRESIADELARAWTRVWVAVDEHGAVVGFLHVWLVADEIHVINVATSPAVRRQGHAGALLAWLIAFARQTAARVLLLEVRASNRAAIALYEAHGFAVVGDRRGYYDDGEDALLMTAQL